MITSLSDRWLWILRIRMRINKYIASAGIASRRKADDLIKEGKVSINGAKLTDPGYDVEPDDVVTVDGTVIDASEKKVYYLLNKPVGYVTTTSDERGRPTVLELVPDEGLRIFPVGRLDQNTSGLLILTNDGEFANKVMHPSKQLDKKYRARVKGIMSSAKAKRLEAGIDIGGFVTSPCRVELIRHDRNSTVVDITIHEGKNRQVRRMFKAAGHPVQALERTEIGNLRIGKLATGGCRKLKREEIEYLTRA
jgi:23S rRNA pseudouridine2605 synthase